MLNIVIPMAGRGSRFAEKGYTFPKPLIEIGKRPMIQVVVDNLRPKEEHRFIFLAQREHEQKYSIRSMLELIAPGCEVILLGGVTAGAACTALLAKEFIDSDDELLIANSDQYVDLDIDEFLAGARQRASDGHILTFLSTHPKWSFVRKEGDEVIETAEKRCISNEATVGIYYYRRGADFVKGAEAMILKDVRVNNEFYVCPVYNEMILSGARITTHLMDENDMWGLGTPEDLVKFLDTDIARRVGGLK